MDKMEMMVIGVEAEISQKEKFLQDSIQHMIELLKEKDITDVSFFNAYVVQAEDIRRFAGELMAAKRVCEALKVAIGE